MMVKPVIYYSSIHWETVGPVMVAVGERGLVAVELGVRDKDDFVEALRARLGAEVKPGDAETRPAREQLSEYFAGERRAFDLSVDLSELTEFQREVLGAARDIPYGQVSTYGELARRVGRPNAARAVGQVMAHNPVPVVIPCHRVLGANGSLGGFNARGGLGTKQALLDLEEARR